MMFLRHGIFARKSAVERRRKLVIGSIIGLLLVTTAVIYAAVKAAGSYDLAYTDASHKGLTSGNITGVLSTTDYVTPVVNLDRDGKATLHLEFGLTDDVIADAKTADAWTYDLNSAVSDNAFIASFDDISTPVDIQKDGVVIAKYTVSNNVITIVPEQTQDATDWWANNTSSVIVGVDVDLNIDKVGANTRSTDSFDLPGTITPSNPSGNSTNMLFYDTPHVAIYSSVYDEGSRVFKYGENDNLISVAQDGNGDYIATYNTNFYTDAYASDLNLVITFDEGQSPVLDYLKIMTCATNNCIHGQIATAIDIPSGYINTVDARTIAVDIEGFLYDYCEVGGHDCTAAGIYGYTLNNSMSANNPGHSDYYIEYKANLGSTNPAGNGKIYSATSVITGNNGSVTATDTVRYSIDILGSKTGTCESGSTTNGGITTCDYVHYEIVVGSYGVDLSNTTITDKITDNQVLEGEISIISSSGASIVINKPYDRAETCASESDDDCVVWNAIDDNYSTDMQKLFSHTFSSGDIGEWRISYVVKIVPSAINNSEDIDNKIDLKLGQNSFQDVWATSTNFEFTGPINIEKTKDYVRAADGLVHWTITVHGPATGSLSDVTVVDQLQYDTTQYSIGTIANTIDSATKTVNGVTTEAAAGQYSVSTNNGNMQITIPMLDAGEIYTFGVVSQVDNDFKAAYAGDSVVLQNQACRSVQIGNNTDTKCSAQVRAAIMTPSADVMTKAVQEDGNVFYWKQNHEQHDSEGHDYVGDVREGYLWTVKINPDAASVIDASRASDYEPWFTDVIPAGLYVTYRYDSNGEAEPECQGSTCDPSTDIDQSKYSAVINVRREIASLGSAGDQYVDKVPISITNGVIEPINLAALFNDNSCTIPNNANPSLTCAGINGVTYTVTYATTLADNIYYDYANEHTFQNQAQLYEKVSGANVERANAASDVVYRNTSVLEKIDPTLTTLDASNKITYVITVNKAGYAHLNNGEPYAQGETRPMLTITDAISNDVNIMTTPFSATNLDSSVSANNTLSSLTDPIICTDVNDNIVNDCSFNYDSSNRTLTARVPDGYVRKIWYSVVVANPIPNKYSEYENTAVMTVGAADFTSTAKRGHTVNGNAGYTIANGTMRIKKVNAGNLTEPVQGAEFKLAQVAYDNQGALGNETVIDLDTSDPNSTNGVSDNSGLIEFNSLCGFSTSIPDPNSSCPNGGQLYYWQEVSAPAPYTATDGAAKHYFVLYDEAVSASDTEANRAVAQTAASIIMENGNNGFAVEVLKSDYQWVVTNIKQKETSIAIEKRIKGNLAHVDDTFSVTITATDLGGQPLNGQFEYCVYTVGNASSVSCLDDTLTFTNGVSDVVLLDHNNGIILYGIYAGGTYEITESNKTGYIGSYACSDRTGEGCTSATSNTGTFVEDTNTGQYPTLANVGQTVTLINTNSTGVTGISNKKPSVVIAVVFGGTMAALGLIVARKFRH